MSEETSEETSEQNELPACPFCGRIGEGAIAESIVDSRNVGCYYCEIFLRPEDWKSRPLEDALSAKNEKLREALGRVGFIVREYLENSTEYMVSERIRKFDALKLSVLIIEDAMKSHFSDELGLVNGEEVKK